MLGSAILDLSIAWFDAISATSNTPTMVASWLQTTLSVLMSDIVASGTLITKLLVETSSS